MGDESDSMDLFEAQTTWLENWLADRAGRGRLKRLVYRSPVDWPRARSLVIGDEVGVELGHPRDASVASLFWTSSRTPHSPEASPHRLYLSGPDLPASRGRRLPFGKLVLIRGRGFEADSTYARYQRLEAVRYGLTLSGHMLRAVSQVHREWSRVSHGALDRGFSLALLGSALVDAYAALDFVEAVTIVFVTDSREAVLAITPVAEAVGRVIAAMHQMTPAAPLDCDTCDYAAVCGEVAGLRRMHAAMVAGGAS